MAGPSSLLRQLGAAPVVTGTKVAPAGTSALTPNQIKALLGQDTSAPPIIVNQTGATGAPVKGSDADKAGWLAPTDSLYAAALGRERQRLDNERKAYEAQQTKLTEDLKGKLAAASGALNTALEHANQKILAERNRPRGPLSALDLNDPGWSAPKDPYQDPEVIAAMAAIKQTNTALAEHTNGLDERLKNFGAEGEARFNKAVGIADTLTKNAAKQKGFDTAYAKASDEYKNAVTQYDKDRAARKMYEAKKAMYDQDAANRDADIKTGKYAVNPYQFLAQGAQLNEIEELRNKVNAGNLRPDMRVPAELVAPEEVKDPGEFKTGAPVHERVADPTVDADTAQILGYQKPPEAKQDAPAPTVSTADVDTSSVTSGYKAPTPEDKLKGTGETQTAPVAQPTGASTLQQTSSTSTQPSQQAPAAQAATPAPALPEQPTGSVAGQTGTSGQQPEQEKPPEEDAKPKPFAADNADEDEDNVFQPG